MNQPHQNPIVGVIGSAGGYGRWLCQFFAERMGLQVIGHDPSDSSSVAPEALAARADVLLFSVPISVTQQAIEHFAQLNPARAEQQLWLDITSVKQMPVEAMLRSPAEVVGLHPMAAPPKTPTLSGRPLVVCEGRLQQWRPWLDAFLTASEAACVHCTPEEHDQRMAAIQNVVHGLHLAQFLSLARSSGSLSSPADYLPFRTTGFEADLATTARMLQADHRLYTDILLHNPNALTALQGVQATLSEIIDALARRDRQALLAGPFAEVSAWFGETMRGEGHRTFERIGYLLADLAVEPHVFIHLERDQPGSLRQLLEAFESAAINIDSLHSSRSAQGEVHFRIGVARDTSAAALRTVVQQIERSGLGRQVNG
ncbi:prephenate dehydrogenase/arogenate dehydrogenase family protein [Pseudomarimonas arenosa]|uniref:Prephenate dehydrogenase n=1 Tax=Pseudomarimonas arenosa TaxID=2774145 RepID=A0AAW3ZRC8_9GAMM|nr:prephenate dehydrogenase/arogenate dehydrogenase family protein [Pseudomarimonas arenosa]MBD8527107.1 prephenate dehydrogenase/arogenate dehydrogenase family protein [Pseudomarimonas arenosa]